MNKFPFSPDELIPQGMYPPGRPGEPALPILSTPVSPKENLHMLLRNGTPLWVHHQAERMMFNPAIMPDNIARGFVMEAQRVNPCAFGGKDMFGVNWEFDPVSRGSMVRQGNPLVPDLEHWEDYVVFPDLDSWDWEGCAHRNQSFLSGHDLVSTTIFTGLFERLISFVDMENALVALIDEDLQDAVHRLFDRLCVFYDDLIGRMKKWFDVDILWFHDDWGSQRGPLMSPNTAEEMLLPYLKRIVDSAHRNGLIFELHSCGKNEPLVPIMVAAGVDMWAGQELNDKKMLTRTFGNQLIIGIEPEPIPADASEAEVRAAIRKMLDDYPEGNFFVGLHRGMHPLEYQILYEESRKRFLA